MSGSLSHIAPASFLTILFTGQPMLISTISVLVFSWINSAARARLSSSLPKSWIDTGFSPSSIWSICSVFSLLYWIPLSETISMTTSPAPSSLAMVRKAELVTPAIGARTVRLGISTSPIINGVLRFVTNEFLQVIFVKVVVGLAELAGNLCTVIFIFHLF